MPGESANFPPAPSRAACLVCGAPITAQAAPSGNDWEWRDEHGRALVDLDEWMDDPGAWDALAAESFVAYQYHRNRHRRAHVHTPAPGAPFDGVVPECHGLPMRLAPKGWVCRAPQH